MSKRILFSRGNNKLPRTSFILNVGSAKDCPSEKLGLCPVANICYAKSPEHRWPAVLPYRRKQRRQFTMRTAQEIANALLFTPILKRKTKIRMLRFSEAGDFRDQADVHKMTEIAMILAYRGVKTYGYTARTDLDLSALMCHATVNVSNDLNDWIDRGANRFKAVPEFSGKALRCKMDCTVCDLCSRMKGKVIEVEYHSNKGGQLNDL